MPELKKMIEEVLSTLAERDQKIIRLRFGLDDGRSRTLDEVKQEFGVTRERIRQIENRALRLLRHPTRSRILQEYYQPETELSPEQKLLRAILGE